KVMQHLGLVLDRLGHAVYARVCAHEAFRMSSGDPRAALSLALALWRSRLPGLLVFYADIARRRLHNLRPRSERPRIRKELVGLRARAAFYHGHQADARRWGAALWREGADRETAEQVLLGAARLGETGSELRAVDVLRPHGLSLTPSIRQLVEGVIVRERQNLLVVLAARTR